MAKNHKTKLVRAFKRNGKVIVDIPIVKGQKLSEKVLNEFDIKTPKDETG